MEITLDAHPPAERDDANSALAKIVAEHIDLVYAAALRQVRDPGAAEDVTQGVFILLAKKLHSLKPGVVMAGWLMNATRFIARDYLRAEARRKKHEHGAAIMQAQQTSVDWERVEPLLDDALAEIGESNRLAVILKYLQGKSAVEMGSILGISEEAARKRVSRGLDELQNIFRQRGVELSAEGIGTMLGIFAVKPAPAGLAIHATAAARNVNTGRIMQAAKIKMAASILAAMIVGGGAIAGGVRIFRQHLVRVAVALPSAPPAAPDMLTGRVFDTQGKPVAGAMVIVATEQNPADFPMTARQRRQYPLTDSQGRYSVPQPAPPYALFIANDNGFAQASWERLADISDLILWPWGRVEGILKSGETPLPHQQVHIWRVQEYNDPWQRLLHIEADARTDVTGRYVFPRVPPGEIWVYRQQWNDPSNSSQWRYAQVQAGQTVQVAIGGTGRAVVGRVIVPADLVSLVDWKPNPLHSYSAEIRRSDLSMAGPKHAPGETMEQYTAEQLKFGKTQAGQLRNQWMFGDNFQIRPDGTFTIPDLPAGKYQMLIRNFEDQPKVNFEEDVARCTKEFEIPPGAAPNEKPLDIGSIVLQAVPGHALPGQAAPEFSATTLDGKTWKLVDQRGKVVVLMFWSTSSTSQQWDQVTDQFGEFAKRWGANPRVALLGVCLDFNKKTPAQIQLIKSVAGEHGMQFPQTLDAPRISRLYDASWPEAILIGRDRKVVQKHLTGETLEKEMAAEMRK